MEVAWSAREIAESVAAEKQRAEQVVRQALEAVEARNDVLKALRDVQAESAIARAKEIDRLTPEQKRARKLCGVPVVIKDNLAQRGRILTAGRPDGAGEVAREDAAVVERLQRAGAIVIARANMDELAYGVTGSNPHTGQVRNPWDTNRHPGGSSAGVGAAVAAGMAPVGIGTDTGGSVRIPASVCGLMGVRPSREAVPTHGVAPLSRTLDTVGPLTTTVRDAALVLGVMMGKELLVPSADEVKGKRIMALEGTFALEVTPAVEELFSQAREAIREGGAEIETGRLEVLKGGPRASGPIIGAEASYAWAEELENHPEWFGDEVADLLRKGMGIKAVRLLRAQDEARAVVDAVDRLFEDGAWALILPTTVGPACEVERIESQLTMLALTAAFSLGGWPSVSVPMGQVQGMPVGLQVVTPRGEESRGLAIASLLEKKQPWPRTSLQSV